MSFFPLFSFQYIYAFIKTTFMNRFCVLLWAYTTLHPRRFVAIYAKTDTICTWSFPCWVSTYVRPPVRPDIKVINGHWLRCLINYLPSSDGKGWAVYMAYIYPLCLGTFTTFKISKVAVSITMSNTVCYFSFFTETIARELILTISSDNSLVDRGRYFWKKFRFLIQKSTEVLFY